jgi:uncharacterized membrane protein YuzA (DUF378 family)
MATKGPQMSHEDYLELYREYKDNGDPVNRYWLDPEDKWWDIGFYAMILFIAIFAAFNVATTGIMTPNQFALNHAVTYIWVVLAAIYTFVVVFENFFDPKMREHR